MTEGWKVKGSCRQCGECCKKLMRMSYMLKYPNPLNPDNWCKHLFEESDKWFCEIGKAYETGDAEFLELLPQLEHEYYLEECKDYPDPKKPAHVPPKHELLEGCGFTIFR